MAVTSEQLASYEPESASSGYESASPPAYLPPVEAVDSGKSGFFTTRNIIIIVVVLILLLVCCCCSLFIGGIMANPEILEDLGLRLPSTWLGYV